MADTELLKIIFHHDQRMEHIAPSVEDSSNPLAMFTAPDPTFSTLYFSGTLLDSMQFGVNNLSRYEQIVSLFENAFNLEGFTWPTNDHSIVKIINGISDNESICIHPPMKQLYVSEFTNSSEFRKVLEDETIVLFKRPSEHGFDIQCYSKDNIYLLFFYHLQAMLVPGFRIFSINGKRVHNKDFFYFETTRLEKPPHGFEEVFKESVL